MVFPARAGMSRIRVDAMRGLLSVPRASGDEPHPTPMLSAIELCSPRERG